MFRTSLAVPSLILTALSVAGSFAVAEETVEAIPGIGPTGPIQVVHDGFKFAEGPAADAQGHIYFVDMRAGRVHRANPDGDVETIAANSQGTNGLIFDGDGQLLGCQGNTGSVVAINIESGRIDKLPAKYDGNRFIQPNDLIVDRHGGIYFTDPTIGTSNKYQDSEGVYYIAPGGAVTRLVNDLRFPNGIALSPDESTLYVLPYLMPKLMAYEIESPGKLGASKELYQMPAAENGRRGGGDGMTVDTNGNLYLTAPRINAICIVSPEGEELGRIPLPATPTNCAFGGEDFKTLYITTANMLYAAPMQATGHCLVRKGGS